MSWQTPGGDPPPDPETPPSDPADQPPAPTPPEPDTETARVPWEAAEPTPPTPPTPATPAIPPAQPLSPMPPPASPPPPETPPAWSSAPDAPPAGDAPPPPAPGGGSVLWASPTAPAAAIPGAPGLTFADTGSRFVAWIIDIVIVYLLTGIVAGIIAGAGAGTDRSIANQAVVSVPYVLLSLVYFVGFWSGGRRATIGQRLFAIQVGNAFDGKPLTLEQAIRRWLGYGSFLGLFSILPGIGGLASLIEFVWDIALLITTAQSPTKQGLHDRFANTALVRPVGKSSSGIVMACLIVIVILVGLAILSFIALIFLGSQVSDMLLEYRNTI
jgi:uncharacterized RDD family membrane protein YckC